MDAYKLWVRKNRDLVRSLESLTNGVTWILPEQFGNYEVGPEAVYAFLGIVTSVNKHIIDQTPTEKSSSIPWALVVSILKEAEAVVEVAAQHFVGDDRKWGFLAVTEAVKACVRLAAFRESGYSMLLQGGEVENEEEEEKEEEEEEDIIDHVVKVNVYPQNSHEIVSSKGKSGLSVLVSKISEVEKPSSTSVWSWKGRPLLFMFGEAVHIFRPLVYVLMVTKLGIRSWTPWLVSLALELAGLGIHSHLVNHGSAAERDELKRRKMIWALHVMRDPFFANYTRRHLKKAERVLNPVPLIFLGKLVDMAEGLHSRYTYTSGS